MKRTVARLKKTRFYRGLLMALLVLVATGVGVKITMTLVERNAPIE